MQGHALAPAQLEPGVDPGGQLDRPRRGVQAGDEVDHLARTLPSGGYAVKRRRRRADVVKDELSFLGSRLRAHRRSLQKTMNLSEILSVLWHRKWVVVLVTALALGCAVAALRLVDPVYESTSTLALSPAGSSRTTSCSSRPSTRSS